MSEAAIVDRSIGYSGWLTLSILSIRMRDGRVMRREVVEHGQAVCILA